MNSAVSLGIGVGMVIFMMAWSMHYATHRKVYTKVVLGTISVLFTSFAGLQVAEKMPVYFDQYIASIVGTVFLGVAFLALFRERLAQFEARVRI